MMTESQSRRTSPKFNCPARMSGSCTGASCCKCERTVRPTAAEKELIRSGCTSTDYPHSSCHTCPGLANGPTTALSSSVDERVVRQPHFELLLQFTHPHSVKPSSLNQMISLFSSLKDPRTGRPRTKLSGHVLVRSHVLCILWVSFLNNPSEIPKQDV
jgi:hypothetical protein